MGKNVYANGLEVSGKASDHQVIAAMPDVCLSPPPPPAGPAPIPYPDSSRSADLQDGSKDVSIGGQPVCLGSKSHYKSSPLGDEACTKSFGTNVVDHTSAGKTHCQAFSMNVTVEGEPVTRTGDITTSNHASQQPAGAAVPMIQTAGVAPGVASGEDGERTVCDCCGGPAHSEAQRKGQALTESEWYNPPYTPNNPPTKRDRKALGAIADAQAAIALSREASCGNVHPEGSDDPCAKHYVLTAKETASSARDDFGDIVSPSVDLDFLVRKFGEAVGSRAYENSQRLQGFKKKGALMIAHKTPLSAGGCPIGVNNTSPIYDPSCKWLDHELGDLQESIKNMHKGTFR